MRRKEGGGASGKLNHLPSGVVITEGLLEGLRPTGDPISVGKKDLVLTKGISTGKDHQTYENG